MGRKGITQSNGKTNSPNDPGRYDFMGLAKIFAIVSVVAVLGCLAIILTKGFVYGIDFAGGIEMRVKFDKPVDIGKIRDFTSTMGYKGASVQTLGSENEYLVRLESVKGETEKETNNLINALITKITSGFKTTFSTENPVVRSVDSVGPQIGNELKKNGLLAVLYSLLMILVYVGLRFDYKFAPGAVFCLFHDAIITLGIYSIFGREVNIQTMAAILTIIGYSLNDTIVTFDRIRENAERLKKMNFTKLVNRSINDVLSRTLLTSITTLIAVGAMYIFAGGVIKDFVFTLAIGVIVGTYSSIYVASPLVLVADYFENKNKAKGNVGQYKAKKA